MQHRSAGAEGQNTSLSSESEKLLSRKRLKPERLSTRAVQHIAHKRSRKHAIGVHALIRADRGAAKARTSRAAFTATRSQYVGANRRAGGWRVSTLTAPLWGDSQSKKYRTHGTAVARSKKQTWTRMPRLVRKRRNAVQDSQHLHNHEPRKTRSRGRRSSTDRRILGSNHR